MGIFDGILGHVNGNPDVANLAGRLGIDPVMAEKAIAALGFAHQQPGDTAQIAAQQTGLGVGTIQDIISSIGGEGSLGKVASMVTENPGQFAAMLDRDGDGSVVDDLTDLARGFLGKS